LKSCSFVDVEKLFYKKKNENFGINPLFWN
jgi:hypothetical protein